MCTDKWRIIINKLLVIIVVCIDYTAEESTSWTGRLTVYILCTNRSTITLSCPVFGHLPCFQCLALLCTFCPHYVMFIFLVLHCLFVVTFFLYGNQVHYSHMLWYWNITLTSCITPGFNKYCLQQYTAGYIMYEGCGNLLHGWVLCF